MKPERGKVRKVHTHKTQLIPKSEKVKTEHGKTSPQPTQFGSLSSVGLGKGVGLQLPQLPHPRHPPYYPGHFAFQVIGYDAVAPVS